MFRYRANWHLPLVKLAAFALLLSQFTFSVHEASLEAHDEHDFCEICVVKQGSGEALAAAPATFSALASSDTNVCAFESVVTAACWSRSHPPRAPPA